MSPILWPDADDDPYTAWETCYDRRRRRARWRWVSDAFVFVVWAAGVVLILGGFLFW